jgi:hypothetical protein
MGTPFDGVVHIDGDRPAHRIVIDDLDRPDWTGTYGHPITGAWLSNRGEEVLVTLQTSSRAGEVAWAHFVGDSEGSWLAGSGPFTRRS